MIIDEPEPPRRVSAVETIVKRGDQIINVAIMTFYVPLLETDEITVEMGRKIYG